MWIMKLIIWIIIIALLIFSITAELTNLLELLGINPAGGRIISLAIWIGVFIIFAIQRQLVIEELQWRLDEKRNLQERIDRLADFRSEAINKYYARTPEKEKFSEWKEGYFSWQERVENYFKENFPYAMVEIFADLGTVPAGHFVHVSKDPEIAGEHLRILRMLEKQLKIIEAIIDKHTTVTFEREPTLNEVIKHVK